MIASNELRKGNYLNVHVAGAFKVKEIKEFDVVFEGIEDKGFYDYSILHPIELSPEVLEKFGFEKYIEKPIGYWKELDHFKSGEFHLQYEKEFTIKHKSTGPVIKYLHQLQNIYFCLCGEELQVNL